MEEVSLSSLAKQYGTDKEDAHDYMRRYTPFLAPIRHTAAAVAEIGIAGGASLRVWRDYFPNAMIYGLDHNEQFVAGCQVLGSRVVVMKFEARSRADWLRLAERCPAFD